MFLRCPRGKTPQQVADTIKEAIRRIDAPAGRDYIAFGDVVPWRRCDGGGPVAAWPPISGLIGHAHAAGVEDPRAQPRSISPGFFAALGVPILAGRDFNDARRSK